MKTRLFLLLSLSLVLLAACHSESKEVSFVVHSYIDKPVEADTSGTSLGIDLNVNITLMQSENRHYKIAEINRQILEIALNCSHSNPDTAIAYYCDKLRTEWKSTYDSAQFEVSSDNAYMFQWMNEVHASPEILGDDFVTYAFHYETYWGGAHPEAMTFYHVFDLKTGKLVEDSDILDLSEANIAALDDILLKTLKDQLAADTLLGDSAIYDYWLDKIHPNGNLHIGENTLGFYYNVYEIAPYASGPTEIAIPTFKIHDMMRPESPIYRYWFK